MARGRAKGYDEQREAILARAGELFALQGYHAASMNQVAEACGLSKATLYHYFPSKADLLRSVVRERRYGERLALDVPPLDPAVPTTVRLVADGTLHIKADSQAWVDAVRKSNSLIHIRMGDLLGENLVKRLEFR